MYRLNQSQTPIIDSLQEWVTKIHAPFYTPGHKRGIGMNQILADQWGAAVFGWDLPELPGLDNLHAPVGAIGQSQLLAAEVFGAQQTWFLVNGSTTGVIAAILATCGEGEKIILPRNIHSSAISGIIHAGAVPIFITPEYDLDLDIAHSITPAAVKSALEQHPDAKAVMVVYPTYYGVCGDLAAIGSIVHSYGIPLLVDEAHGAHFGFHPDLPPAALTIGADLTVQSTHKLLGSLTQSAMLHVNSSLIDVEVIGRSLRLLQSTSPSYLLLASLDAARQQMALQGEELMSKTIELAQIARAKIDLIDGLAVVKFDTPTPGCKHLDPTRLTVTVTGLNLTGFEADEILTKLGVVAELPSMRHLTFIISLGNSRADIDRLVESLTELAIHHRADRPLDLASIEPFQQTANMTIVTPRQADRSPHVTISIDRGVALAEHPAIGKISAESISPYPPGIPILIPGEIISIAALNYLQRVLDLGGELSGCSDPTLATIQILED
jgi:arginine decarboxylase